MCYRNLPELPAKHIESVNLPGFYCVYFEVRNVDEVGRIMYYALNHKPGLFVSLELEKSRDNIDALYPLADLIICSRHFAEQMGHNDPQGFLRWMRLQAPQAGIIAAWGEDGAYGRGGKDEVGHATAMPPPKVVDHPGAVDTINPGMIDADI